MKDITIRIAVAGNVDSGKSTLAGVLLNDCLDDGRGKCRKLVLRNKHERDTGRTSTVSFNNFYKIEDDTRKIISLIDLAGHEKYLKTTMSGITGLFVDYGLVLVAANMGITKMTKEHLALLLYLKKPIIILLTKVDIAPEHVKQATIRKLKKIVNLPIFNKRHYTFLEDEKKCENELDQFNKLLNPLDTFIPIIPISNKTGLNISNLKNYLLSLRPIDHWENKINGSIMYIDSDFMVKGIGLVISGTLRGKTIKLNQKLYIGPIDNRFIPIKVRSLHNNMRENVLEIQNGEVGCIAIRCVNKDIITRKNLRKGLIVVDNLELSKNVCRSFKAKISVLNHSTTIRDKYQPIIHCGLVRQAARIKILKNLSGKKNILRTNSEAIVEFTFSYRSEYVEKGTTIFFRDGRTKGYGTVIEVYNT